MKLRCPVCGSRFSMAEAAHEAAMNEMIDLASKFGKNWGLVFDYTECFRQGMWSSVREQKRLRLLREVRRLFEKTEFEVDGKCYRTDWASIIRAMRMVVDAEKYGFKNHNYLKKVLLSEKAERLSTEGMTPKEEQKKIEDQKLRRSEDEPGTMTAAEYKARQGIESLVDKIGSGK